LRAFFDSPGNPQVSMMKQRFLEKPSMQDVDWLQKFPNTGLQMVWWKHSTTIDLGDITGR
jgi:hypothetical protein